MLYFQRNILLKPLVSCPHSHLYPVESFASVLKGYNEHGASLFSHVSQSLQDFVKK